MFDYLFIGFIAVSLLSLYCFIKRPITIIKISRLIPLSDARKKIYNIYLDRYKEIGKGDNNTISQVLPLISVVAIIFILGNQYIYLGTVLSGSMEPIFQRGDLVFMQAIDKEPKVGDIIMYTPSDFRKKLVEPITHRIISVDNDGIVLTRGDANAYPDTWNVKKENIMGKAVIFGGKPLVIKGLGSILVPKAGEFSIMDKLTAVGGTTYMFQRYRAMMPVFIFFLIVFYFFALIESRTENNRRFGDHKKSK